jgi:hypothetical protein
LGVEILDQSCCEVLVVGGVPVQGGELVPVQLLEPFELVVVSELAAFLVALEDGVREGVLEFLADLEDGGLDEGEPGSLLGLVAGLLDLGPAPLELLSLGLGDALDVLLVSLMLVLCVRVRSSVRKVALATEAAKISTFGVFPFSPPLALLFHMQEIKMPATLYASYEYQPIAEAIHFKILRSASLISLNL